MHRHAHVRICARMRSRAKDLNIAVTNTTVRLHRQQMEDGHVRNSGEARGETRVMRNRVKLCLSPPYADTLTDLWTYLQTQFDSLVASGKLSDPASKDSFSSERFATADLYYGRSVLFAYECIAKQRSFGSGGSPNSRP